MACRKLSPGSCGKSIRNIRRHPKAVGDINTKLFLQAGKLVTSSEDIDSLIQLPLPCLQLQIDHLKP